MICKDCKKKCDYTCEKHPWYKEFRMGFLFRKYDPLNGGRK